VAGLAAGLRHVTADRVVVLAVDQPGITAATVARLLAAGPSAVLVDQHGQRQWLAGVWETTRLERALPGDPRGASMRSVLESLAAVEVGALAGEARDVDTPDDLRRVSDPFT
jgi:CTP:molybdopterin cytidylyltransferase MocA